MSKKTESFHTGFCRVPGYDYQARLFRKPQDVEEESRIQEIETLHQEIVEHLKCSLKNVIRIGELLTVQKESLEHGEFMPWVQANLPFSHRTATRYMSIYRWRDRVKLDNVTNLTEAYGLPRLPVPAPDESGGEKVERTFLTVSLDPDQREVIMTAVGHVKDLLDTDSNARALEHIAFDYMEFSGNLKELLPVETAKGLLERVYGVKLTIQRNEEG